MNVWKPKRGVVSAAFLWTYLDVSEQFGQVKLPLLTEARELQQETDRVVRLVQTRQALHRSHGVQTLSGREGGET